MRESSLLITIEKKVQIKGVQNIIPPFGRPRLLPVLVVRREQQQQVVDSFQQELLSVGVL